MAAWSAASAALEALGCEVVDVEPPFPVDAEPEFEALWYVLSLSPVPAEQERLLLPLTRWMREQGRAVTPDRLLTTMADLQVRVRQYARRQPGCDLYLSPTLAQPQAPIGWFTSAGSPAADFARQKRFSPYCAAYNLTGQPAASLPVGVTADGDPVGVMLAGAVGADAQVIAVSAWLEASLPWADRHPPMWSTPTAPLP